MNAKLKILLETIAGALGGFVAWALMEPIPFLTSDDVRPIATWQDWLSIVLFGAIFGACVGAGIGAVDGLATGSSARFQRALGTGIGIGFVGGVIGLYFGQIAYQTLLSLSPPSSAAVLSPLAFLLNVVARSVGWAFVGLFIGLAQGVPTASLRKMKHGAIGGVLGGFVGGFLFEITGQILRVGGVLSRFIAMTLIGGFVGLFVSLVQDLLKHAWVIVLRGRNEGREYVLDKPENILGRDELADVGVFGDPSVAHHHAVIKAVNGRYVIEDLGTSPSGTLVNGQRISSQPLTDGDRIQLGVTQIVFHEKVGAAPVRPRDVARPSQRQGPAVADNLCAFCGQPKDPRTGACACTPVAPAPAGFAPAPQGAAGSAVPSVAVPGSPPQAAAGIPALGGPRLVGVSGPMAGQVVPLTATQITIGREAGRDLVIADATVSRRHAVLQAQNGGYLLTDEGSANGTYVNGVRIQSQLLRPGDRVRFGQSEFLYEG